MLLCEDLFSFHSTKYIPHDNPKLAIVFFITIPVLSSRLLLSLGTIECEFVTVKNNNWIDANAITDLTHNLICKVQCHVLGMEIPLQGRQPFLHTLLSYEQVADRSVDAHDGTVQDLSVRGSLFSTLLQAVGVGFDFEHTLAQLLVCSLDLLHFCAQTLELRHISLIVLAGYSPIRHHLVVGIWVAARALKGAHGW